MEASYLVCELGDQWQLFCEDKVHNLFCGVLPGEHRTTIIKLGEGEEGEGRVEGGEWRERRNEMGGVKEEREEEREEEVNLI